MSAETKPRRRRRRKVGRKRVFRPRCDAYENARRCTNRSVHKYRGVKNYCQRHYARAMTQNGEVRGPRELRAIQAKKERRAQLIALGLEIRKGLPLR